MMMTGRAAIKTFLGDDAAKTKSAGLSLKNGTVTGADVSGDTGWISGNYTVVDGSGAAVDSGSYLSVHKRTNGQWLYIRDTGTRIVRRPLLLRRRSRAGSLDPSGRAGLKTCLYVRLRASRMACTSDSGTSSGTGSLAAQAFASTTVFS